MPVAPRGLGRGGPQGQWFAHGKAWARQSHDDIRRQKQPNEYGAEILNRDRVG